MATRLQPQVTMLKFNKKVQQNTVLTNHCMHREGKEDILVIGFNLSCKNILSLCSFWRGQKVKLRESFSSGLVPRRLLCIHCTMRQATEALLDQMNHKDSFTCFILVYPFCSNPFSFIWKIRNCPPITFRR